MKIKCNRCKCNRSLTDFELKKDGSKYKTCLYCRNSQKKYYKKNNDNYYKKYQKIKKYQTKINKLKEDKEIFKDNYFYLSESKLLELLIS